MAGTHSRRSALVLTGKVCPWLFREIELHLSEVQAGETVTLITTPGEQTATVARSLRSDGHAIVEIERHEDTVKLTVRKEAPGPSTGPDECCPGGKCR
ncbi:MAG: sulfurtransferase TusA family protein [Armatimonadota bacterium]|jgi:tRNA 2-thiouridine synthesizing protein A